MCVCETKMYVNGIRVHLSPSLSLFMCVQSIHRASSVISYLLNIKYFIACKFVYYVQQYRSNHKIVCKLEIIDICSLRRWWCDYDIAMNSLSLSIQVLRSITNAVHNTHTKKC